MNSSSEPSEEKEGLPLTLSLSKGESTVHPAGEPSQERVEPQLPPPVQVPPPEREQGRSLMAALAPHWESAAYGLLILVALVMRLWDLGSRAMGYDESLHTYYSFRLAEGLGFQHTPMMHGPFQFHGMAFLMFLFGDSESSARLLVALFGTALVGLPYFLRDRLGRIGALATAVMLAFSPMMLYYSRYARDDIIMAVWALALVVLIWRYLDEGKPRYLYLSALVLALAFATMESTFLVVAVLGSYLVIVAAPDWIPWLLRRPTVFRKAASTSGGEEADVPPPASPGSAEPAPGDKAESPKGERAPGRRPPHRLADFSRPGVLLLLVATLVLPQASPVVSFFQEGLWKNGIILANLQEAKGVVITGVPGPQGAPAGDVLFKIQSVDVTKGMVIAGILVFLALWFSALVGTGWNRRIWLRCAALFYGVWLLLYTTFFTNVVGVGSGMWQSMGYWIMEQKYVGRADQPWYYYFIVTPVYEMLPFLFSIVAVVYYAIRGNSFTRFLAYWAVFTFLLYTWAGEKMPWLVVNMALPMIVLSGKLLGDILVAVPWRRVWRAGGLGLVPMLPLLIYLLLRLLFFRPERGNFMNFLEFWALLAVTLTVVGLGIHLLLRSGVGNGLRVVAVAFALVLLFFGVRAAWEASYRSGDVPTEMIVYAQDSGDVPDVMDEVWAVARRTGLGEELRLTVDKDIYWGLIWYLRSFKNVDYADLSNVTQAPEGRVLLISDGNEGRVRPYLDKYGPGMKFLYLWWPAEGYKPCAKVPVEPCLSTGEVFSNLLRRDKWREGLDFYIYRKTDVDFLFHRAIAYFPKEY
ncbi:MAG: 2 protein [Dehalococcoidia bacterium]|nr:2 protein [Dehalococcoidia bacterium]